MADYPYISQNCRKFVTQSVPLFRAAIKDDWKTAKALLNEDASMLTASITGNGDTVLHVASMVGHVNFVEELLQMMSEEEMMRTNSEGHTALCITARQGSLGMARLLLDKATAMARVSGGFPGAQGTPLYHASVVGNREMAEFLFPESGVDDWNTAEKVDLLTTAIESRLYVLAAWVLERDESLALIENSRNRTPLQTLADNPIIPGCAHSSSDVQRLCRLMLDGIIRSRDVDDETGGLVETIKCVILRTAKSGNVELLAELFHRFPDIIYEDVEVGQGILQAAVSNRNEDVYNLLFKLSGMKELVASYVDESGNNALHIAANLGPSDKWNTLPIDLQIQRELSWFKEVEKIVPNRYRNMTNLAGDTPKEVFNLQHKSLLKKGEEVVKRLLFAAVLASVLTSVFVVPSYNSFMGMPTLPEKWFLVLYVLKLIAITSSWGSTLTFVSVLTSYLIAKDYLIFLPLQLLAGMIFMWFSIVSLCISALFVTMRPSVAEKSLLWCAAGIAPFLFGAYHLIATKVHLGVSSKPAFRSPTTIRSN